MNRGFWYYTKSDAIGRYLILDDEDDVIVDAPNEQEAFKIVNERNCQLLTEFERAKKVGRAPGSP